MFDAPAKQSPRFSWVELATNAASAAIEFYGTLFAWRFHETALLGDKRYITFQSAAGQALGAIYELDQDAGPLRPMPHWLACVQTDDIAGLTLRASTLGGQVELPVFELGDYGQMAILRDPAGARLGLLQTSPTPFSTSQPGVAKPLGSFCWHELATAYAKEAGAFYRCLFQWQTQLQPAGEAEYVTFENANGSVAGMLAMDQRWARHPAHWLNYVAVEDASLSLATAVRLGAKALSPVIEIPDACAYAVLRDPQDAVFAVLSDV